MLSQFKRHAIVGTAALFGGLLSTAVNADLTLEILDAIENGRTIRAEITSLKTIPVPEPSNLNEFVKNKKRAIELGKALFWDMQVGSDGVQACASCHFNAGADSRAINQLSPGILVSNQDATPNSDTTFTTKGPNAKLTAADFPFHLKIDRLDVFSDVVRDSNDVVSSAGVHFSEFENAKTGKVVDETTPAADPLGFQVGGVNTRRVEPRNTPTVINAVFNHRNFWDGRASNIFNGVSPFGDNDPNAFVYKRVGGEVSKVKVSIDNASLASQAVGPPLSEFEMSANGRYWLEIGDKFVSHKYERPHKDLRPLGLQKVHAQDSVLGKLARKDKRGLKYKSYEKMIKKAFHNKWWNGNEFVMLNEDGSTEVVNKKTARDNPEITYSQMEANFSLFFGLAVQLYEATLVSDDSPVDRFLDGDVNALTSNELVGFHLADVEARCLNCHGRGEFTFAAVSRVEERGLTRIRRGDLIDEGFNNIGVRPTLEDLGVGGVDPNGNPLSFGRLTHLGGYDNPQIEGDPTTDPNAPELATDVGADGAFKIPTLRNVALTAPYFHNGGEDTLEDVVDMYFRGGNFRTNNPGAEFPHPIIGFDATRANPVEITGLGILQGDNQNSFAGLNAEGLDDVDRDNIVAFLKALTDPRVPNRQAPFDHPQLFVPVGHAGDDTVVIEDANGNAVDNFIEIEAVGRNGGAVLPTFADELQ
jgi:cytochrome c peroxidase